MRSIVVKTGRPYEVITGQGLIDNAGEYFRKVCRGKNVLIVSDDIVFDIYGNRLRNSLERSGFKVYDYTIPHGEASKSFDNFRSLLEFMTEKNLSRDDAVAGLGGGVPGDLSGFASAAFKRGTTFVQVPTTLLAAVDSSVGGKTGINIGEAKNQAGAFHQPALVIYDTETLDTLPGEEFVNGLGEVIKYAMIGGYEFFGKISRIFTETVSDDDCCVSGSESVCGLKAQRNSFGISGGDLEEIIADCVRIKAAIVEEDEYDRGRRAILNFGHTAGHAIEGLTGFEISHGRAVSIGMVMIARAAASKGLCTRETAAGLEKLLVGAGLPTDCNLHADLLAEAVLSDKKVSGEEISLIVPLEPGLCDIIKVSKDEIKDWMSFGKAEVRK